MERISPWDNIEVPPHPGRKMFYPRTRNLPGGWDGLKNFSTNSWAHGLKEREGTAPPRYEFEYIPIQMLFHDIA